MTRKEQDLAIALGMVSAALQALQTADHYIVSGTDTAVMGLVDDAMRAVTTLKTTIARRMEVK